MRKKASRKKKKRRRGRKSNNSYPVARIFVFPDLTFLFFFFFFFPPLTLRDLSVLPCALPGYLRMRFERHFSFTPLIPFTRFSCPITIAIFISIFLCVSVRVFDLYLPAEPLFFFFVPVFPRLLLLFFFSSGSAPSLQLFSWLLKPFCTFFLCVFLLLLLLLLLFFFLVLKESSNVCADTPTSRR